MNVQNRTLFIADNLDIMRGIDSETIDQMVHMVQGMDGKQLRYRDLTAGNSL